MASTPISSPAPNARARAARLERAGDLAGALAAYETALAAQPNDADLLASVAGLAERMEMHAVAAGLWERVGALQPDRLEALDGRAKALRAIGRFDDAVSILRLALLANPDEPRLWNSLGSTLTEDSQAELALTFFDEAIRLDPRFAPAVYNRGGARFDLGRLDEAAADFAQARKLARKPADIAMIEFAASTLALTRGDVGAGWDGYEFRFSRDWSNYVAFEVPGRRWTPGTPLAGKRLLVVAEQGLGDEIMFANVAPDVIRALGPDGRLHLAVEPRLVELFRRSFPGVAVSAHATTAEGGRRWRSVPGAPAARDIDYWAPLGSLCRQFRRSLADFPAKAGGYLKPDPARIAHWRGWLGAGPPAVGISWRSGKLLGERRRQYAPQAAWAGLLKTPGVRFVNLQYGDCADELRSLSAASGAAILEPPELDIREDIDDLAALCVALDLVLSVANATAALAGASGAALVMLCGPASWPRLGSDGYPWYPAARALAPAAFGEWDAVMAEAAATIAELAAGRPLRA